MKNKVFGGITGFFGLMSMIGPRYILPYCELTGKNRMACSYTSEAEIFFGMILIFIGIGTFLSKTLDALRWLMLSALACGIAIVAAPSVLGYCHNPDMPCHYGTVPFLRLLGVLAIISSLVGMSQSRQEKI